MPKPTREDVVQSLDDNPDITLAQLALKFGCSPSSMGRYLQSYGLKTKSWGERSHSDVTRQKISHSRKVSGVARGSSNPNFGVKARPWLEGEDAPLRRWHREHPDFGEQQRGVSNPVHKVKHLYSDPEYLARITSGIRAHVDQRRGSTYEEIYGEEKAAEYKQKLRDASPARLAQFKRRETMPEQLIREMLLGLGLCFQQEAPLGPYTVDFLVEDSKLVIQADGDYWHANPSIYSEPTVAQSNRRRLDASCDSFLHSRGYRVIRFWESDLKTHPENCLRILQEILHG